MKGEKKVLGVVDVPEFESLAEAVAYYESQAEEPGTGEREVLRKLNAHLRIDMSNAARISFQRGPNVFKELRAKAAKSPEAAARIKALLEELEKSDQI